MPLSLLLHSSQSTIHGTINSIFFPFFIYQTQLYDVDNYDGRYNVDNANQN